VIVAKQDIYKVHVENSGFSDEAVESNQIRRRTTDHLRAHQLTSAAARLRDASVVVTRVTIDGMCTE